MTNNDEISAKETILKLIALYRLLLKKWLFIGIISFVFAALGFLYILNKKPTFIAKLTFSLELKGETPSLYQITSQLLGTTGGQESVFSQENIIELMKSRNIIEKTLLSDCIIDGKKQMLINRYIDFNEFQESWSKNERLKNIKYLNSDRDNYTMLQDSILGAFHKNISENNLTIDKIDRKLSILNVQCETKDEMFSKLFVENLVNTVCEYYVKNKTKKAKIILDNVQYRTDSVKQELYRVQNELAQFKDANLRLVKVKGYLTEAKLTQDLAILSVMYGELTKNLEMAKLTLLQQTPLVQIIDKPILPLEKKKASKKLGVIVGGFLGLLLSCGFVIIRDYFKKVMAE